MEGFSDWDWVIDHEVNLLYRGTYIFIGDDKTNKNNDVQVLLNGQYIILQITNNDGETIEYDILPISRGKILDNLLGTTSLGHANELLDERYWRILSYDTPSHLFKDDSSIKLNDFTPYLITI